MIRVYHSIVAAVAKSLPFLPPCSRASQQRYAFFPSAAEVLKHDLRRALCISLIISLLATSTPAASQTIVGVAQEWRVSAAFWLRTSGSLAKLKLRLTGQDSPHPSPQESQIDRDARIRRIRISPDDVTARIGETVRFAAVAYDAGGDTVGGVKFTWSAKGDKEDIGPVISPSGEFSAPVSGKFKISVEGAGKTAQTKVVTVLEGAAPITNAQRLKVKDLSTRDLPPPAPPRSDLRADIATRRKARTRRDAKSIFLKTSFRGAEPPAITSATTPVPQGSDQFGWNTTNYMTADDPGSQPGDPPGSPLDDGAGNGNFQIAAPVVSLPGRGINVSLGLAYNAHLWHKAGSNITYDIDRGWPAPGWSLGFGKMEDIGDGGSIIIEADGTRHGFNGLVYGPGPDSAFSGQTTDGSFINYSCVRTSGVIVYGSATLPNGTSIVYGAPGDGAIYPTQITDPNGNYVTVTYRSNSGPQIDTVKDTLGRDISFHYDGNNLLTAVTAPALNGGGTPRTLVRLNYQQQFIGASFSGLTRLVRNTSPWLLNAIYYPATGTGYWFGDSDSFLSSYGTIAKVIEQRGMTLSSGGLNDMGTVTPGTLTTQAVYSWQTSASDAPNYSSVSETWAGMTSGPAVTTYLVYENASPRTTTVTLPNGTKSIQYSHNAAGQFNDGLIFKDETYDTDGTTLLSRSEVNWVLGDYNSPRPSFTTVTTRQGGNYVTTGTEFSYAQSPSFNQVIEVRNYDYGYVPNGSNTLLSKTVTEYENSFSYTNRHIFNLPKVVSVYASDGVTRVSRTDYTYDGVTLQDTPGVVQHSDQFNPFAPVSTVPGHWETHCSGCPPCSCTPVWIPPSTTTAYRPETDFRGNVTQVKTYADAATLNETTAVVEARSYDIDGNMVKASTTCCQQTSFNFTEATKYAYAESQTRGSATDPYAQVTTSATYDFNTGLVLSGTDANGRTSQTSYSSETLRPQTATLPSDAHTDYAYDDTAMTVTETTFLAGGAIADQNIKLLNGRGQVRQEKALGASGVWDIVDAEYDSMGRAFRQSLPYRSGTPRWTNLTYDALSRTKKVIAPDYTLADASDGSTTETFYNEAARPSIASTLPGETTRVRDAWGRERWGRTDAQGRLVEVVEPNPSGSGSVFDAGALLTTYAYNTLGNLTQVTQGVQMQTRSFKYDSLGRLTAQKLAEASATLNDAGTYVGSGTWSDVFTYDTRSNLIWRADARGVKTIYSYLIGGNPNNPDPLNRLQSVSWDTSGFGDTSNPIIDVATVSYSYRTKENPSTLKDITQLSSVTAAGVGLESTSTESYVYDGEGRVSDQTVTLASRSSYPWWTTYSYDSLDRINNVTYPAEYGNGAQPRKVVHHDYDVASRLTGLTVDGATHASQIAYNAASQTTSLKVGLSGANQITESYAYNSQTGLLDNQTVARGATTLLDLSYDYAGANGKRTGQLAKILNNRNHNKDRGYSYDALGRLIAAQGGPSTGPLWTQNYSYDRYGNRTSVTASGSSARNQNMKATELAKEGSAGILPAMSKSEPGAVATGSSAAIAQPGDPKISLPTEQLAARTDVELPDSLRTDSTRSAANSHHASRSALPNTATPQGNPPVFTDPNLLAPGVLIRTLHITELRIAINDLRVQRGYPAFPWLTSATGLIKADPIIEMRAALDGALGQPSPAYSAGLAQGQPILAIHIQELRDRVVANWNSSSSIPVDGHANLTYELATNRINTSGFQYDAAGNQTRIVRVDGSAQKFQYDAANRLANVRTDASVIIASYTYGDSNERLIAEEGGSRTYYACDGSVEYTESGSSTTPHWSKSYIYLGARLLSTLTPNGSGGEFVQYHHPDRLGTRLVTNAQDTTYFEQQTLPFGTALDESPPTGGTTNATNRRFTTYDRNLNTRLDYAVNRHYDPQQGRFTQVDPIGMGSVSLESPQTLNLYAYCTNDPINHVDPNGLGFFSKLFKWIGTALKILSIVALVVMTVIIFAPASSFAFKAALWMFFHVLLPLSQIPVLGAFVPLGTLGSPQWNPQSRGPFGNSFQGQGSNCPPDCQEQISLPPVSAGTIYANYSGATWWRNLRNFLAGAIDNGVGPPPIPGLPGFTLGRLLRKGIDRAGGTSANEDSWSYTVGSYVPDAVAIVASGGAAASEEAFGLSGRIALDVKPHPFPPLGRYSHLQLDLWKTGVKRSNFFTRRIPLFTKLSNKWKSGVKFRF